MVAGRATGFGLAVGRADMEGASVEGEWLDEAVATLVGEGLVDVVESDAAGIKTVLGRFQTGDVAEERGSGEASEDDGGVVAFESGA